MSRLNQWKARKQQPKADSTIEQESVQIDQLRNMLMTGDPDEDELNEVVNEELNEQFVSSEGLNSLLKANIKHGGGGISIGSSVDGKVSTIMTTKDDYGRFNLTEDQQFALDAYNYEQGVSKQFEQDAVMSIIKQQRKK